MSRPDGRAADDLRPITITRDWQKYAEGSALIEFGETKVLCAASVVQGVPRWRKGSGEKERLGVSGARVKDGSDGGRAVEERGPRASLNRLRTARLRRGIIENDFGAVFGGARRDEEKARAKERGRAPKPTGLPMLGSRPRS